MADNKIMDNAKLIDTAITQYKTTKDKTLILKCLNSKDPQLIISTCWAIKREELTEFIPELKNTHCYSLNNVAEDTGSYHHSDEEDFDMEIAGIIMSLKEIAIEKSLTSQDNYLRVFTTKEKNIITISLENISSSNIYLITYGGCSFISGKEHEIRAAFIQYNTQDEIGLLKQLKPHEKYTFKIDYYRTFSDTREAKDYEKRTGLSRITYGQGYMLEKDYTLQITSQDFNAKQRIIYSILWQK